MTSALLSLPMELQYRIIKFLDHDDDALKAFLPWSCTCSFYRSLLAPHVFRTIALCNDETSGKSVRMISNGPYAGHVRKLQFKGSTLTKTGRKNCETRANPNVEKALADDVEAVLSSLGIFPNLQSLLIEFDFSKDGQWEDGYWTLPFEEDTLSLRGKDESKPWMRVLRQTFEAVVSNDRSSIWHLELRNLICKPVRTFTDRRFHAFLGGLRSLRLSLLSEDHGAPKKFNTTRGFYRLAYQLDRYMFDHLTSVEELSVRAGRCGPWPAWPLVDGLPLRAGQMPRLRALRLHTVYADPALVAFLAGHAATLERVVLESCYTSFRDVVPAPFDSGVRWRALFDALRERPLPRLRRFDVAPRPDALVDWAESPGWGPGAEGYTSTRVAVPETVAHARMHYINAYACVNGEYDAREHETKLDWGRFRRADDERAYNEFVEQVLGGNQSLDHHSPGP